MQIAVQQVSRDRREPILEPQPAQAAYQVVIDDAGQYPAKPCTGSAEAIGPRLVRWVTSSIWPTVGEVRAEGKRIAAGERRLLYS